MAFYQACQTNWLTGGDFNMVKWPNETATTNLVERSMHKFNEFINRYTSIDPHSQMPTTHGQTFKQEQSCLDWTYSYILHNGKTNSQYTSPEGQKACKTQLLVTSH